MRGRGLWLSVAILAAIAALLIFLRGPGGRDSPDHQSSSDAPNGTSALRLFAQALDHPVDALGGSFTLPTPPGLLFLFSPVTPFTADEVKQLHSWIEAGGTLVYAAEEGDGRLNADLELRRKRELTSGDARAPAPLLGGVHNVTGTALANPFETTPNQVPLLRSTHGSVLALTMSLGKGRVVALADPLELCNGFIDKADNGRLAADLIALAPAGMPVFFDEFHHGIGSAATSPLEWLRTPWGAALGWVVLVLFIGLALRGRAFGPSIPLTPMSERSSAEYASAVGGLLQRTGARHLTLQVLANGTRRAVAARLGLSGEIRSQDFPHALAHRAPAAAASLAQAEKPLSAQALSDGELLQGARQLHALAFPTAPKGDEKGAR